MFHFPSKCIDFFNKQNDNSDDEFTDLDRNKSSAVHTKSVPIVPSPQGTVRGRSYNIINHIRFNDISEEIPASLKVDILNAVRNDFNGIFDVNISNMTPAQIIHCLYAWLKLRFFAAILRLYERDRKRAIEICFLVIRYWGKTGVKQADYVSSKKTERDIHHIFGGVIADEMLKASGDVYAVLYI